MSDQPPNPGIEKSVFFRPRAFLLGLVAGLTLCSTIARVASHQGYHEAFTRFFPQISPEAQYYPTLEEMCGIVRMRCRPDQVLVIVGGNSIFNGVGQPAAKMWTVELQRQLGEGFVVVNFAFRGALCTDGGAVVAEALRKEYPRQVYVANAAPFTPPAPYGIEPYRYLFWEARSRGLLESYPPRDEMVEEFERTGFTWGNRFDLWGKDWLDRVLRFRDLWNLVGYEYLFTIANPITPHLPQAVWARKRFADVEPDFEAMPLGDRFRPENRDVEMRIVRGFSEGSCVRDRRGAWRPKTLVRIQFEEVARGAVPDDLKARTLIMLSRNCPYYLRQLTADERLRDDAAYRDGAAAWRKAGYEAADYGRDYDDADFGDRTHLSASGGRKLALQVSEHIQEIARKLGYLNQQPPKP
jgi:lysophospholipase L1-like esterase